MKQIPKISVGFGTECDHCGAAEAAAYPYRNGGGAEWLCPACTARQQRRDLAERELLELLPDALRPVLASWAARHGAELAADDLAMCLEFVFYELAQRGHTAPELLELVAPAR